VEGPTQHIAPPDPNPQARSTRPRTNIRSQDLVSVPVLRALLQQRNVTRAADVVGLNQPAVSHALPRLRRRLGDEILVRVGREVWLTPLG
jgi:Bacterial regulatory helix-turn-helix protein, lysR family